MPRALVLGNGRMLVNFDDRLNMRDLYFPRVGMTNHIMGHKNGIGIWVDGRFEWLDGPGWTVRTGYEEGSLAGESSARHGELGLELTIRDAVHFRDDLYLKTIRIANLLPRRREVRLFFTHDFCVDESDIGDTSFYDPGTDAIVHYKRDKWFLMSGHAGEHGIFQYANGTKRFAGAEGTWRDAEDGWLEGNPIAQGSVDSCISFRLDLGPHSHRTLDYWIAAGRNLEEVRRLHRRVRRAGVVQLLEHTRAYWRSWLGKKRWDFKDLSPGAAELFYRSLLVVRTQIDRDGAITAANDSDILHFNRDHYSYVWPRDGALVAYALDSAGYSELTRAFYQFCRRVIAPGGYLLHKYHPDGSVGSSWHPWLSDEGPQLPIQEDETALVLHALWHFFERERDLDFVESLYASLIKPAGDFMVHYRDLRTGLPLESYDLWEERRGVFTFTASAVWAGLMAASRFARLFGEEEDAAKYSRAAAEVRAGILEHLWVEKLDRFARGLTFSGGKLVLDTTLESSLYGLHAFGVLPADDPRVKSTILQVEEGLTVKTPIGGVARYERDYYFARRHHPHVPGNPWFICTLWIAQWYIATARAKADLKKPREILEWCVQRATPSGLLSEQIHPDTGEPLSVTPLTWSHSTYIQTVLMYVRAMKEIEERARIAEAWHARS
ncbi:MAG: glycoside hydrolase family 15 [Firmicutes bacterium]|nr:glycoside hydrolase family 15 [Bacillota bacterium]